jgi:hypothetical protein
VALHTETAIYRAIFDLTGEAAEVIRQMRRDIKPVFGRTIVENCLAMEIDVRAANMTSAEFREPHLQKLLERLASVETIVRVCRDKQYIKIPAYARLIAHTQSVGKQANGWRRHHAGDGSQRQLI